MFPVKQKHALSFSRVVIWLFGEALYLQLSRINRKLDIIMALVSIEQSDLDDIASTVSDVADTLQGILDSDTPTPPADETALRAAVEKLQNVGPKTQVVADE